MKKMTKMLKRLVGEETGAVMMEYIILACLIAAAVVVAVAYFGRTATDELNIAQTAMAGGGEKAAETSKSVRTEKVPERVEEAVTQNDKFSDAQKEGQKEIKSSK